jgi:hypothetical protein
MKFLLVVLIFLLISFSHQEEEFFPNWMEHDFEKIKHQTLTGNFFTEKLKIRHHTSCYS